MKFRTGARFHGEAGTLSVEEGEVTFGRVEGVVRKRMRSIVVVPVDAIVGVEPHAGRTPRLVVTVDRAKVPGPLHYEFAMEEPSAAAAAVEAERRAHPPPPPPAPPITVHIHQTIPPAPVLHKVMVRCPYCRAVYPEVDGKCPQCGAAF